jgi:hypothetical protein
VNPIALTRGRKCQWEGCLRPAVTVAAAGEQEKPGLYCEEHASLVIGSSGPGVPETRCPNCGCRFGVC